MDTTSYKAFCVFDLRRKSELGSCPQKKDLLAFMTKELLRKGDTCTTQKKLEFFSHVFRVPVYPRTLSAYAGSPLQVVIKNGALESLEAMVEYCRIIDDDVMHAAMLDIISADVPRDTSCRMVAALLKLDFVAGHWGKDGLNVACVAVQASRLDILEKLVDDVPYTTELASKSGTPLVHFVGKVPCVDATYPPCPCDKANCNVDMLLALHKMGVNLSEWNEDMKKCSVCAQGIQRLQEEMAKLPKVDFWPDEDDSDYDYWDDEREDSEERVVGSKSNAASDAASDAESHKKHKL
jgi:hypothetical protein